MFCSKCGTELPEGLKFCTSCGQLLGETNVAPSPPTCPQCGSTFSPGQTFCAKCGYRLTPARAQAVPVPEAPPVRRSASVSEVIAGGEVQGKGLRIAGGVLLIICGLVTVIFGIVLAVGAEFFLYWGADIVVVFGIVGLLLGLVAVVGGSFACAGKNWGLALAGAICEMVSAIFVLWPMFFLAILPLVFISVSRKAFT